VPRCRETEATLEQERAERAAEAQEQAGELEAVRRQLNESCAQVASLTALVARERDRASLLQDEKQRLLQHGQWSCVACCRLRMPPPHAGVRRFAALQGWRF